MGLFLPTCCWFEPLHSLTVVVLCPTVVVVCRVSRDRRASARGISQIMRKTSGPAYFWLAAGVVPIICRESFSFSWQMDSISSNPGRQRTVLLVVQGLVYAPGSSMVTSYLRVPKSVRR